MGSFIKSAPIFWENCENRTPQFINIDETSKCPIYNHKMRPAQPSQAASRAPRPANVMKIGTVRGHANGNYFAALCAMHNRRIQKQDENRNFLVFAQNTHETPRLWPYCLRLCRGTWEKMRAKITHAEGRFPASSDFNVLLYVSLYVPNQGRS